MSREGRAGVQVSGAPERTSTVVVGEQEVVIVQTVWKDGKSAFSLCESAGKFSGKFDDGREFAGRLAYALSGAVVVDVKYASAYGNGQQSSTFEVSTSTIAQAVLALIERGEVMERVDGKGDSFPVTSRVQS